MRNTIERIDAYMRTNVILFKKYSGFMYVLGVWTVAGVMGVQWAVQRYNSKVEETDDELDKTDDDSPKEKVIPARSLLLQPLPAMDLFNPPREEFTEEMRRERLAAVDAMAKRFVKMDSIYT